MINQTTIQPSQPQITQYPYDAIQLPVQSQTQPVVQSPVDESKPNRVDESTIITISNQARNRINPEQLGVDKALQNGVTELHTAKDALDDVQNILKKIKELSVKAIDNSLTYFEHDHVQTEINNLLSQVDRIHRKNEQARVMTGSNQGSEFPIPEISLKDLGIDNIDLSEGDQAMIRIDDAMSKVQEHLDFVGANHDQLLQKIDAQSLQFENLSNSDNVVKNKSDAKEFMKQIKDSILNQSVSAFQAQANQDPQFVLSMIR